MEKVTNLPRDKRQGMLFNLVIGFIEECLSADFTSEEIVLCFDSLAMSLKTLEAASTKTKNDIPI